MHSSTSTHNFELNKSCVSPILRRVFSRSGLYLQTASPATSMSINNNRAQELQRPDSRISTTDMSIRSGGSSLSRGKSGDLSIDVTTEENVQFMDQPLKGKIDLSGLPAPVESVAIALRGVVKTCVAGNAAWASGFGGESNVMARFTEKEILKQEFTLHPCTQPATPLSPDRRHTLPFVFLFPGSANLPPSMTFPQGLGSVEYALHVVLKGKKKFGSAKKWTSTLILKVEISRRAIGARLETMAIADAIVAKTKHMIILEHPRIILPGYTNHYFTLHFPQGLLQVHTFEATLVQRSFYKALGGNYRGASMVGLVCRVGQAEANVREAGMERVHVEIQEVVEEGLESSVEVDGIIERKHLFRVEVSVIVFKRGIEKVHFEVPVTVQCAAVPESHVSRRGTMSSMHSASSSNLRSPTSEMCASILRASRSVAHFPSPPARVALATTNAFDASPPESPREEPPPTTLGRVRMNSKTWRDDELPGLAPSASPQLQSPVKLDPPRTLSKSNWTLVRPGIATLDQLSAPAPTPPPTCPIPEIPVIQPFIPSPISTPAPVIPPRSSSRLASARQTAPSPMCRTNSTSASIDDLGRRTSQDTITTSSVTSSPSDYISSGRSTAATSVSSSPSEVTLPLKPRLGALSLRKVEEMGSGGPFREGFNSKIFKSEGKGEQDRREFQRRIDLALSEVEKLALEESDGEITDGENEVLSRGVRVAV